MATDYLPVLNIPWIEGVLAGKYSRPEVCFRDEVMIEDRSNVEVIDTEMDISMNVEQMTLAPSGDQHGLATTQEQDQGTDPSTMNSNPTVSDNQQDKEDKQEAGHECSGSVDNKNAAKETVTEEDLDVECLCASDEVVGIILEKREATMVEMEAGLTRTEEIKHRPLSKQHAMLWIGDLLDKHIAEHLELLESDLAEYVANNPRVENAEHFDANMKIITEYQISQALEKTRCEMQRIMMVKNIVEMLIYHEHLEIRHSLPSTFPEYLMELRSSDGPCAGLKRRLIVFFKHMFVLGVPLDELVECFFDAPEWRRSSVGLEIPLERWGGLAMLLHIRENDAIMNYLVNFMIWYFSAYAMTYDPIYHNTKLLRDIKLSAQDREIIEKIWLDEKPEGTTEATENDSVPVSLPELEGHLSLPRGSVSHWISKAVRKKPDVSLSGKSDFVMDPRERLIEVVDSDFHHLYHKYTGKLHPDEHRSSGTRMSYRGPAYKRHVLIDIQGEDWSDMMERYGFDVATCEQDSKQCRGNEALWAIIAAMENGEWRNEVWLENDESEEQGEARERFEERGQAPSSCESDIEAGGVCISNPADDA